MAKPGLILASLSPRRKKLFSKIARRFLLVAAPEPKIHPDVWKRQTIAQIVERMARFKAMWAALRNPGRIIVGADTLVLAKKRRMGKAQTTEEAARMLKQVLGHAITAHTGVCIVSPKKDGKLRIETWHEKAGVKFAKADKAALRAYLRTAKWKGKAGAFNIDEKPARAWVERMRGDADAAIGLPLGRLKQKLAFYSKGA